MFGQVQRGHLSMQLCLTLLSGVPPLTKGERKAKELRCCCDCSIQCSCHTSYYVAKRTREKKNLNEPGKAETSKGEFLKVLTAKCSKFYSVLLRRQQRESLMVPDPQLSRDLSFCTHGTPQHALLLKVNLVSTKPKQHPLKHPLGVVAPGDHAESNSSNNSQSSTVLSQAETQLLVQIYNLTLCDAENWTGDHENKQKIPTPPNKSQPSTLTLFTSS